VSKTKSDPQTLFWKRVKITDGCWLWQGSLTVFKVGEHGLYGPETYQCLVDFDRDEITPDELAYGDYTPGRYAWILKDVKQIDPVPAKGHLGLWNWDAQ
jgi:hypothetical protein